MPRAANAFRQRQLVVCAPGEEPGLHILMADVMPGSYLTAGLAQFRQRLFPVGISRACVRHESILPGHDFDGRALVGLPDAVFAR
jgi:hypothetical protein